MDVLERQSDATNQDAFWDDMTQGDQTVGTKTKKKPAKAGAGLAGSAGAGDDAARLAGAAHAAYRISGVALSQRYACAGVPCEWAVRQKPCWGVFSAATQPFARCVGIPLCPLRVPCTTAEREGEGGASKLPFSDQQVALPRSAV